MLSLIPRQIIPTTTTTNIFIGITLSCLLLSRLRYSSLTFTSNIITNNNNIQLLQNINLETKRRVIIVGDVHGCADELKLLLQKTLFDKSKGDQLLLVGDLVRKGPKNGEVIDVVMENEGISVRGNHDHYAILDSQNKLQLNSKQLQYLSSMPLALSFQFQNLPYYIVHAGLLPGTKPVENDMMEMMTMRNVIRNSSNNNNVENSWHASTKTSEGLPWAEAWFGPQHVIFGHDAKRKLQQCKYATGLDSGCVYGGELTALVLPGHELVNVPSLQPKRFGGNNDD
jgi:bis(5'-nucleosyl)-tetraphosphatase (symmetrical)